MSGTSRTAIGPAAIDIGTYPGAGFQIAGVGDFNNDGTDDVFWHNPGTGATDIWLLQNGKWSASVSPGNHPLGYQVAGTGDFNGDGHSDVLFYNRGTRNVDEWALVERSLDQQRQSSAHIPAAAGQLPASATSTAAGPMMCCGISSFDGCA